MEWRRVGEAAGNVNEAVIGFYVSHRCITFSKEMATSFRIPSAQMSRLVHLASRLGTSKAQVIKRAIDRLYEEEITNSPDSARDRLLKAGFQPLDFDPEAPSVDEAKQRMVIRARLSKKYRAGH